MMLEAQARRFEGGDLVDGGSAGDGQRMPCVGIERCGEYLGVTERRMGARE